MGVFDKLKNVFFEEEYVEVEEPIKKPKKEKPTIAKKIDLPEMPKIKEEKTSREREIEEEVVKTVKLRPEHLLDLVANQTKINQQVAVVFVPAELFSYPALADTASAVNQQCHLSRIVPLPLKKLLVYLSFHCFLMVLAAHSRFLGDPTALSAPF